MTTPEFLNTSLLVWYETVVLGKSLEESATGGSSWIDVRDLAEAHTKALEKEAASGERIIVAQGRFTVRCPISHSNLYFLGPFIWQNWGTHILPRSSSSPLILTGKQLTRQTTLSLRPLTSSYPEDTRRRPRRRCTRSVTTRGRQTGCWQCNTRVWMRRLGTC